MREEIDNIKAWLDLPTGQTRRNGEPQLKRHLFSLAEIEVSAGMPERSIHKWLVGHRPLPAIHVHNLIDVLESLGYKALTNDHALL